MMVRMTYFITHSSCICNRCLNTGRDENNIISLILKYTQLRMLPTPNSEQCTTAFSPMCRGGLYYKYKPHLNPADSCHVHKPLCINIAHIKVRDDLNDDVELSGHSSSSSHIQTVSPLIGNNEAPIDEYFLLVVAGWYLFSWSHMTRASVWGVPAEFPVFDGPPLPSSATGRYIRVGSNDSSYGRDMHCKKPPRIECTVACFYYSSPSCVLCTAW